MDFLLKANLKCISNRLGTGGNVGVANYHIHAYSLYGSKRTPLGYFTGLFVF